MGAPTGVRQKRWPPAIDMARVERQRGRRVFYVRPRRLSGWGDRPSSIPHHPEAHEPIQPLRAAWRQVVDERVEKQRTRGRTLAPECSLELAGPRRERAEQAAHLLEPGAELGVADLYRKHRVLKRRQEYIGAASRVDAV